MYGFIPLPESNMRVIGNRAYSDAMGIGPWNLYSYRVINTKNGGIIYQDTPNGRWTSHQKYRQTRNGYAGTSYAAGNLSLGPISLRRVK